MSPRTGRPKALKPKEVRFSIRLDSDTEAALLEYCRKYGLSKGEAIRKAIDLLLKGQ